MDLQLFVQQQINRYCVSLWGKGSPPSLQGLSLTPLAETPSSRHFSWLPLRLLNGGISFHSSMQDFFQLVVLEGFLHSEPSSNPPQHLGGIQIQALTWPLLSLSSRSVGFRITVMLHGPLSVEPQSSERCSRMALKCPEFMADSMRGSCPGPGAAQQPQTRTFPPPWFTVVSGSMAK